MKRSAGRALVRSIAATILVLLYGLGIVGVSSLTAATPAQARGRGGGGRGFRGRGVRGGIWLGAPYYYGYGYGYGYDDRCFWSPRRGRWICPSYYRPYPYYW